MARVHQPPGALELTCGQCLGELSHPDVLADDVSSTAPQGRIDDALDVVRRCRTQRTDLALDAAALVDPVRVAGPGELATGSGDDHESRFLRRWQGVGVAVLVNSRGAGRARRRRDACQLIEQAGRYPARFVLGVPAQRRQCQRVDVVGARANAVATSSAALDDSPAPMVGRSGRAGEPLPNLRRRTTPAT